VSDAGRTEIVSTLNAIEKQFVADVARGRNVPVEKVLADFGQGGVKVGGDGVKAGMADKVQSYDTTLNILRKMVVNQRRLAALRQQ
jgi:ClpP class serine protease